MTKKQPEGQRAGEGTLLYPGKNPHRCKAPHYRSAAQRAVWQCDCGKRWELRHYSWCRIRRVLGLFDWVDHTDMADHHHVPVDGTDGLDHWQLDKPALRVALKEQ